MPLSRETAYAYNDRGELTQIFTPEGSVNYEYDSKTGAKTRVYTANSDIRYTYDALNRLKTVAVHMRNGVTLATPEVTTYDYTKIGSRASVTLPNGVTTNYQYDNLNRLTQLTHEKAGTLIASYSYELLPTGRRAAVTEITPEGSSEIRYTYDNLYRLTKEVRSGVKPFEASYTYDINSNRIQKVLESVDENDTINYVYNANDQLTTEVSSANGATVYGYNLNGSLITKENTGKYSYQYGYDLRNRLVSANITRKEGLVDVTISSRYTYNADGIRTRVMQTINGVTQNRYFLLDDGHSDYSQVFEETSSLGGNVVRSYIIGDDVLSQTVGNVTSHLLYDGHGSTRQLANIDGGVSVNYAYDAYGKMLGGDPNVTDRKSVTDLLYAGEQFDAGLQMEYLRARYYDQNTGRFGQLDPFDGNSDDPQSLHKYAYAHCDPVNGIDPSGEFFLLDILSVMSNMMTMYSFGQSAMQAVNSFKALDQLVENFRGLAESELLDLEVIFEIRNESLLSAISIINGLFQQGLDALKTGISATGFKYAMSGATFAIKGVGTGIARTKALQSITEKVSATARQGYQGHHAFPKYLGGQAKQKLVYLHKDLHKEYHRRLNRIAKVQFGKAKKATAHYAGLSDKEKIKVYRKMINATKKFDKTFGVNLNSSLIEEMRNANLSPAIMKALKL